MQSAVPRFLLLLLAFSALLSVAGFYLAPHGRANAFSTYLAALVFIAYLFWDWRWLVAAREQFWCVLFVLYLSLSPLWSERPSDAGLYLGYGMLLFAFVLGIVVCSLRLRHFLELLMSVTVLAASVSAVLSLHLFFALPDYRPLDEHRLYGIGRLHNPAVAGYAYGTALVIAAGLAARRRQWADIGLWSACAGALLTAILITQTRGVFVALAATVAVLVLAGAKSRRQLRGRCLALLGVAGIAAAGLYVFDLSSYLLSRGQSYRIDIWQAVLDEVVGLRALHGYGINAPLEIDHPPYKFHHPHSLYLSVFYHGGLLGLVLLGLAVGSIVVRLYASGRTGRLALPAVVFSVIVFMLDGEAPLTKIDYLWLCFWLPVGIALAALQSTDRPDRAAG